MLACHLVRNLRFPLLQKLSIIGLATLALETAFLALPSTVKAYPGPDDQCPYGWDTETNTCLPSVPSGPGGGSLDASCQSTAQFKYCQGSVYVGCNSWGSVYACRLLQLSYSDPRTFQAIMNAQKSCNLDGDQQACNYLAQFKGYYY
jgi:hypothetical protein